MNKNFQRGQIILYHSADDKAKVEVKMTGETVWLTQDQMAELFKKGRSTIAEHILNVFRENELEEKSVCRDFRRTGSDDKEYIVKHYNLDVIISVGYRVKSLQGTQFRIWATKTLRSHILKGYTINRTRIAQNYGKFLEAVESVKKRLPQGNKLKAEDALELVRAFATTWFSLEAYDKSSLPTSGATRKQARLTAGELTDALRDLRRELVSSKQASALFGDERGMSGVAGIVGNLLQSFNGKDLYPTLEEKAAHLLYLMVKNHPFVDGNKRSGAFAFVWFLSRTGVLDKNRLSPETLTVLTLLVAESDPKDRIRMTGLILMMLRK